MLAKKLSISLIIIVVFLFVGQSALADRTYTTSAEFGDPPAELVDVDPSDDQLQIEITETPFVFVNIAASARDTIVRINADDGEILGEYRTAPNGRLGNPSRTTVDSKGNVWTANRDEDEPTATGSAPSGSVVKIGIVIGGTRVTEKTDAESGEKTFEDDPLSEYLQGPFKYNTCVDRNGDGLIRTSSGLGNILPWPGSGDDGAGSAVDECILLYVRLSGAPNAHHVSVDTQDNNNVWVGGYPDGPAMFYKLDGQTGAIEDSFDAAAAELGCGGFGGLVDANGVIWSADFDYDSIENGTEDTSALLYYDPDSGEGGCMDVGHSYGLAADSGGFIWNSMWLESQVAKINASTPGLGIVDGFPKAINPGSSASEGVAVTPDDNVWVARPLGPDGNVVSRLDNDGNLVSVIDLHPEAFAPYNGDYPTGVAVDANGKVWVTNLSSNNVMRIDPAGGIDGLGAVDLTILLGTDAAPDNYSDMTGVVNIVSAPSEGTWTVVYDGGTEGTIWDTIVWNTEPEGDEPSGTSITVEALAADTEEGLGGQTYQEITNGGLLSLTGQFIQIRATLKPDSEGTSPILSDLTVKSVEPEPEPEGLCDVNGNGSIDIFDILGIFFTIGDTAAQSFDPRDWDDDKTITIIDARGCVLECTNTYCAPEKKIAPVE